MVKAPSRRPGFPGIGGAGRRSGPGLLTAIGLAASFAVTSCQAAAPSGLVRTWRFEEPAQPPPRVAPASPGPRTAEPTPAVGRLFHDRAVRPLVWTPGTADATAGGARFDPRQGGGVRIVFYPAWSTRQRILTPGQRPGTGPGHWARLCQLGRWNPPSTEAAAALVFDPDGSQLAVLTRDARGAVRTNFLAAIRWTELTPMPGRTLPPPTWHEIAFNFSRERTELILDGQLLKDTRTGRYGGPGIPELPADAPVSFGSDPEGTAPANGWIREVALLARAVSPLDLVARRAGAALTAEADPAQPAVTLRWPTLRGDSVPIERRDPDASGWQRLGETATGTFRDADPALQAGRLYEYRVDGRDLITVALGTPPVETRGGVLVLVDERVRRGLADELARFRDDLVGDGWRVRIEEAPRHDDDAWRSDPVNRDYLRDLETVRERIRRANEAFDGRLEAIVLVGHVTIPYSGDGAEDGHPEHHGAWPADSFYGDLDGVWTDTTVDNRARVRNPVRRNIPRDGKPDPTTFRQVRQPEGAGPTGLEAAVGRIDFANLPAFRGLSEIDLLRRYFAKNHRYRHGELRFDPSLAGGAFFWGAFNPTGTPIYRNAVACASRLFPEGADAAWFADAFGSGADALWAMQGGYGGNSALHNSRDANRVLGVDRYDAAWLAAHANDLHTGFLLLMGSYFGDWNLAPDNFLRACLALPEAGLAVGWTRNDLWEFNPLGLGEPLGEMLRKTARDAASVRTTFILGDPTLRLQVTPPPRNLTATREGDGLRLRWEPAGGEARYRVFRLDSPEGSPVAVHAGLLSATEFTITEPPRRVEAWLVRAYEAVRTGSGVFTNASQAAWLRP